MKTQGLLVFLIIGYGIPYGIEAAMVMTDVLTRDLAPVWVVWGLYVFPALGAWVGGLVHPLPGEERHTLWPVSWPRAIVAVLGVSGVFLIVMGAQILLGAVTPDWELPQLTRLFEDNNMTVTAHPANFFFVGFVVSVLLGVFYVPFALLGEYAWRGFLQPRVAGLGRVRANVIVGLAWGMWFAPMAFSEQIYSPDSWSTLTRVMLMALIVSFILGEVLRRTNSLLLCAFIVGSFAVQINDSMSRYLFPETNPPLSGPLGYVSIGIWLLAAVVLWCWPKPAAAITSR